MPAAVTGPNSKAHDFSVCPSHWGVLNLMIPVSRSSSRTATALAAPKKSIDVWTLMSVPRAASASPTQYDVAMPPAEYARLHRSRRPGATVLNGAIMPMCDMPQRAMASEIPQSIAAAKQPMT